MTPTTTRRITMTTTATNPLHEFSIEYYGNGTIHRRTVKAAYIKSEDGMVVFKDHGHGVVFMIPPNQLVAIAREDTPAYTEVVE